MNSKIARKLLCAGATLVIGFGSLGHYAHAQDADAAAEAYAATLQQIADVKLSIAQKEAYIAYQNDQIASLRGQIQGLPAEKEKIRPIVAAMVAEIEKEIIKDVPFRATERYNRLDSLREKLDNPDVGESELFRLAMNMYDAEVNYGNSVGSYTGDNPVNAGARYAACEANASSSKCALSDDQKKAIENGATVQDLKSSLQDGNYIHFGRLSLVYLELDSSEGYKYNAETKAWDKLAGGEIIGIRKAVRISRGESAPGVVRGPVPVGGAGQ